MLAPARVARQRGDGAKVLGRALLGAGARSRCTWINVVPTIVAYLLEGETPPREELARIRFCRSASAALPPEHLRAFEQKFGIGVIETMG